MKNFFHNKKILITGHTGFKGSWLTFWLHKLGAKLFGVGLDPKTQRDAFYALHIGEICEDIRQDIRDYYKVHEIIRLTKPEIIFHLAAQPLVQEAYQSPLYTYETNVMGTANILEAIRTTYTVRQAIMVTSDKVYKNFEFSWGYRENDHLGGFEPYGTSKAAAEMIIEGYRNAFFNSHKRKKAMTSIASVRAGNVIGGGDWSEDRILPDCIRALEAGLPIKVRNPFAVRPWQHILEALGGYLMLCVKMGNDPYAFNGAWNFGPGLEGLKNVQTMVEDVISAYGSGEWILEKKELINYEAGMLALDISKVHVNLNWSPFLSFNETVQWTVSWYKALFNGANMQEFTNRQIEIFEKHLEAMLSKPEV